MSTIAQVALVLAVFAAAVQGFVWAASLVVLAKRVGSKIESNVGWGWASAIFWAVWVVLR